MNVPYNTGKVKIGLKYEPKQIYIERDIDMIAWQKVMLGENKPSPYRYFWYKIICCVGVTTYFLYLFNSLFK